MGQRREVSGKWDERIERGVQDLAAKKQRGSMR